MKYECDVRGIISTYWFLSQSIVQIYSYRKGTIIYSPALTQYPVRPGLHKLGLRGGGGVRLANLDRCGGRRVVKLWSYAKGFLFKEQRGFLEFGAF